MNKQEDSQIQDVKQYFQDVNLDSDDPFGMGHQLHIQSIYSPSLHSKKWTLEIIMEKYFNF